MRLRAMELIADGWSAWAAARELGVSHTAVQRWARGAGVGLAMGAVGGSALAAARRRRAVFEAWSERSPLDLGRVFSRDRIG